jgi:hypothetical protein
MAIMQGAGMRGVRVPDFQVAGPLPAAAAQKSHRGLLLHQLRLQLRDQNLHTDTQQQGREKQRSKSSGKAPSSMSHAQHVSNTPFKQQTQC